MMVPQAIEQLRLWVSTMASVTLHSQLKCNNPRVIDVIGHATRIVSDKTGMFF